MPAICLRCRHYDDKPDLAGDLPETYSLCRWPLPKLPAVMLQHDLRTSAASKALRMIPKRGLSDRPDLYVSCEAHEAKDEGR